MYHYAWLQLGLEMTATLYIFFVFAVLAIKTRAFCIQGLYPFTESYPQPTTATITDSLTITLRETLGQNFFS
jgi:hypothetical protein